MNESERNIKFLGAAGRLWYALSALKGTMPPHLNDEDWISREQILIAQFAYDLVVHASECINDRQLEEGMRLTPEYMMASIPDLTEWPPTTVE